jgi:hypothetical protein
MDLGSSGSTCFFTDTLFRDANTNGLYDQTEEIPGVSVTLLVGGVPHSYFDLSSAVGSFAIPIQRKFRIFATGISMVTYSFATGCPGFLEVFLSGHNSPGVA